MVNTPNTMEDQTKSEVYNTTLLKSLNTNGELKDDISRDTYNTQLKLIKQNLLSTIKSDRVRALQMLQILIDNRVHTILKDVLLILKDTSIEESLKSGILSSVNHSMLSVVRELLINKDVNELASLYSLWQNDESKTFINILRGLYSNPGNRVHIKTVLFNLLIPIMLDTNNLEDPMKIVCIDLALDMAKVVPITILNSEEYAAYSKKIIEYVTVISALRDGGFNHWHKLWMFLIRLLGKKLHHSMSLMNKLLRVVEQSFKVSCVQQRMKSYECWKELIDNVSLDRSHLSTEKQIKLLLTPLKAKFANQPELVVKRFDHFVYLMEKLQDKAVLVVKEFLEFCFGEIGGNLLAPKPGQGKIVPELWLRIAQVLVALMGHSHKDVDNCLKIEPTVNIKPALRNNSNISNMYLLIINGVFECSKLLKEVELNQKRHTLLKCLWKSLFNIVLDAKADNQQACIDSISDILEILLKEIDPYLHSIAIIIFKESVSMDKSKVSDFVLNNLDRFLNIIFSVPLNKESYIEVEKFVALLSNLGCNGETQTILGKIFNSFSSYQTIDTNVNFVAKVWIHLANEAEDYAKGNSLEYLVWPAVNAHKLTEQVTRVAVYEYYECLITKYVEKSPELQVILFKHFDRSLRNDRLLLQNILSLLTLFNPKHSSKEICDITLDILSFMLHAVANDTDRKTIELYLKKMLETKSSYFQEDSTIRKLCSCIENLLKHRLFDVLIPLEGVLEPLSDNIKWLYSKYLSLDFLVDLFVKETDFAITEKVHAIIKQLRSVKTPEHKKEKVVSMPLGGRASKIANLVKQIPKSPKKEVNSPSRSYETNSPFKMFGSQLKNVKSSPMRSPASTPPQKKKPSVNLDDESNSKFVLINSEVKVDKDKLTEHQKDTLKKRREDIPALYQDLSQSVSQSDSFQQAAVTTPVAEEIEIPVFKKPEVPEDVKSDHVEERNELPALPVSDDSSFEEKSGEESAKTSPEPTVEPKVQQQKSPWLTGRRKRKGGEISRLTMNIVGAEEFVAAGSLRAKREVKQENNKKRRKTKDKSEQQIEENKPVCDVMVEQVDDKLKPKLPEIKVKNIPVKVESKPICDVVTEHADNKLEPEIKPKNKGGRPKKPKPENELKETKTPVKRKPKAKSADIPASDSETNGTMTPKETTFEAKRKRRASLGDTKKDEVRKSRRKSLPSSKMSAILQILKPNAKKIEPEICTQSELFSPTEVTEVAKELPEIEPPTEAEVELKKRKRMSTTQSELYSPTKVTKELTEVEVGKELPEIKPPAEVESQLLTEVANELTEVVNELPEIKPPAEVESQLLTEVAKELTEVVNELPEIEAPAEVQEELKKRKRISTSDEDEDIIESSQESSVVNASLSKLRMSISNKSIVATLEPQNDSVVEDLNKVDVDVSPVEKKTGRAKKLKSVASKNDEAALIEDLVNDPDKNKEETRTSPVCDKNENEEEAVNGDLSNERHELEMATEEIKEKSTQSQDTQTQDTDSIVLDAENGKVQVYLDLPVKPILTEADKIIARMDTASLSLVDLEELRGFNNSTFETSNKTVIGNDTLTDIKSDTQVEEKEEEVIEEPPQMESEVILETEYIVEETKPEQINEAVNENGPIESENEAAASENVVAETELFTEAIEESSPMVKEGSPTCVGTPSSSSKSELPSSPITGDTPNRTSELLSNTTDISPIRDGLPNTSSDDDTEQKKFVPVALNFDEEDDQEKEKSPEKGDDVPQKLTEDDSPVKVKKEDDTCSVSSTTPTSPPKDKIEKAFVTNERGVRPSWIKQGSPATQRIFNRRKIGLSMSPSASRIKKLMSNVKPLSQSDHVHDFIETDILTFQREVPSPLAVPRSSILKRKHCELNDEGSPSPCPKRKRVNFSDPCTTSKKVFIKDDPLGQSGGVESLTSDDIDKKFMELMADDICDNIVAELGDIDPDDDIVRDILLEEPAIYPDLVGCEDDVTVMAKQLSISETTLTNKNIKTIGDLAMLSETSVSKLSPIKPMVVRVFEALKEFHQELSKGREGDEQEEEVPLVNGEEEVEEEEEEVVEPVKVDIETELRQLLERAKDENVPLDTILSTILDNIKLMESDSEGNKVLLKMFRLMFDNLVSRLPLSQMMQLFIESLQKIPIKD